MAKWVNQVVDISSLAQGRFTVPDGANSVIIDSESQIYVNFTETATDTNTTTTNIRIPADVPREFAIPRGQFGGTVYLLVKQVTTAATKTCRVIFT